MEDPTRFPMAQAAVFPRIMRADQQMHFRALMNLIQQTLPLQPLPVTPLDTARNTTRVSRYLRVLLAVVAVPLGIAVATPVVGVLFVLAVLLSPLLLVFALAQGWRQAAKEQRRLDPRGSSTAEVDTYVARAGVRLAPSGQV